MSQILDGVLITNSESSKAMGGTELMINRMLKYIPQEHFQGYQIIHSRLPEKLSDDHKTVLVFHDLPNDPMYARLAEPSFREKIDKFVFVSDWQLQYFNLALGIPYSKSIVIPNGIEIPEQGIVRTPHQGVNIIYHTTPHRGLELLYPAFDAIVKAAPHIPIHLDVYSSFKIYGWDHRDEQYRQLLDQCNNHPNITYHGSVSNQKVREALLNADIFAYPCIWPETSCLSLIEACASGCLSVHPNYAALPETASKMTMMYQWSEDHSSHVNIFANQLMQAIHIVNDGIFNPEFQINAFSTYYNFEKSIVKKWKEILPINTK